ncbi:hypothetical protein Q7C36_017419 [Tachysurus vachellii]|uniref:Uncharacterized protein n=1 Tax=Tachysurus vachellii TaxID=175792 RepID=A0AA88M3B8_TACVA|nr:hypothetical protein Q7C36_017419 [Tachysurus vachellii]
MSSLVRDCAQGLLRKRKEKREMEERKLNRKKNPIRSKKRFKKRFLRGKAELLTTATQGQINTRPDLWGERRRDRDTHSHSLTRLGNGYTPASPEESLMDFDLK